MGEASRDQVVKAFVPTAAPVCDTTSTTACREPTRALDSNAAPIPSQVALWDGEHLGYQSMPVSLHTASPEPYNLVRPTQPVQHHSQELRLKGALEVLNHARNAVLEKFNPGSLSEEQQKDSVARMALLDCNSVLRAADYKCS